MSDIHSDYQRIGAILQEAREHAGLTQSKIAQQLGRTKQNISQIENGQARTSLQMLIQYGELVDVDVLVIVATAQDEVGALMLQTARLIPNLSPDRLSTLKTLITVWESEVNTVIK